MDPLDDGLGSDAEVGGRQLQRHPASHVLYQILSTTQGKSGILVDVHSILSSEVIARNNQLLWFWSNGQRVERSQVPHPQIFGGAGF
jgi:hypothetical protein